LSQRFTCPACKRVTVTPICTTLDESGVSEHTVTDYPTADYPAANCAEWFGPDAPEAKTCGAA
ncbi:hypothetical protein LCGC14_2347160, partial [marine sediment metagenome]